MYLTQCTLVPQMSCIFLLLDLSRLFMFDILCKLSSKKYCFGGIELFFLCVAKNYVPKSSFQQLHLLGFFFTILLIGLAQTAVRVTITPM